MPLTVLITGFGRFPGAPHNPTGPLIHALAQRRRPALADINRIAHVFSTSYVAVDRELPALLARHTPDIVLMFGLATRTRHLRIESAARNVIALTYPVVDGFIPARNAIATAAPLRLRGRAPFMRLVTAARTAWPTQLSSDAGRYLCNYLYWQALTQGPSRAFVQFVHVPPLPHARQPSARGKQRSPTSADLLKAGEAILLALINGRRR